MRAVVYRLIWIMMLRIESNIARTRDGCVSEVMSKIRIGGRFFRIKEKKKMENECNMQANRIFCGERACISKKESATNATRAAIRGQHQGREFALCYVQRGTKVRWRLQCW